MDIKTLIAQADPIDVILDVSDCTESPAEILRGLRTELAKLDASEHRYAPVTIRAKADFLALLRLLRWNVVFNFQEVTGLPSPGHLHHFFTREAWTFRDMGET